MEILKRIAFMLYVFVARTHWRLDRLFAYRDDEEIIYIWKDSWFLMWHLTFWGFGRWMIAHIKKTEPLRGELGPEFERQHAEFSRLASEDFQKLDLTGKLMRPTHYRLSREAGEALCGVYGCLAEIAPWQYGLPHRIKARRRMRNIALLSFMVFLACMQYALASPVLASVMLLALVIFAASFSGWFGSVALHRLALGAERLKRKKEINAGRPS